MIDLLIAMVEGEEEPSKTLYFVAGGVLVLFAIGISVFGFTRPNFPSSPTQARAVMAVSAGLTLFVLVAVVITS